MPQTCKEISVSVPEGLTTAPKSLASRQAGQQSKAKKSNAKQASKQARKKHRALQLQSAFAVHSALLLGHTKTCKDLQACPGVGHCLLRVKDVHGGHPVPLAASLGEASGLAVVFCLCQALGDPWLIQLRTSEAAMNCSMRGPPRATHVMLEHRPSLDQGASSWPLGSRLSSRHCWRIVRASKRTILCCEVTEQRRASARPLHGNSEVDFCAPKRRRRWARHLAFFRRCLGLCFSMGRQ